VKVKAIAEAKTDKIDVMVLGHLLCSDLLPEAYFASPATRGVRGVLRWRMSLVQLGRMMKNCLVGVLDRYPELMACRPSMRYSAGRE